MERRSKPINLTKGKEIVIPSEGGYMKYPTSAVLTAHVGTLDGNGAFSKVKDGAGCKAILIVLKNEDATKRDNVQKKARK